MIAYRSLMRVAALVFAGSQCGLPAYSAAAAAYTQSGAGVVIGNGIPMGHEWITRMAAMELIGPPVANVVPDVRDSLDPRFYPVKWTQGMAKNTSLNGAQGEVLRIKAMPCVESDCSSYAAYYAPVYAAIMGERWVDIAGYNVGMNAKLFANDCFDAVAQEPPEIQYDHFMRRYDDQGGAGGVTAAYTSQQRFIKYFVAAALAPNASMLIYDGGGYSQYRSVDRNYFLFGRAVHLFEDSFSTEHTVRIPTDNYTKVRQVKAYLCSKGAEQHSHTTPNITDYASGDVVWNPGTQLVIWKPGTPLQLLWGSYLPRNMKIPALVATEATKDLWAAFIRTMAVAPAQREATAVAEATILVNNWLSYDTNEMTNWYNDPANRKQSYVYNDNDTGPNGATQAACMNTLTKGATSDQMTRVRQLQDTQRTCVYNAIPYEGYNDLFDTSSHMYFAWYSRNLLYLETPPAGWTIPDPPADSGIPVRIQSVANGQYLTAPNGLATGNYIYAKPNTGPPLEFIKVVGQSGTYFRLTADPTLFLSYTAATGAAQLYAPKFIDPTNFTVSRVGQTQNWTLYSITQSDYLNLNPSAQSPYIDRNGNPNDGKSQWYLQPKQNVTSGNQCCWDRLVQGCSKDNQCDPGGEGCVYAGTKTAQYGAFQCSIPKCCWDRLIQGCSTAASCDAGGEGCIASGSATLTYGVEQCNTCEMRGLIYDPATSTCKPKGDAGINLAPRPLN